MKIGKSKRFYMGVLLGSFSVALIMTWANSIPSVSVFEANSQCQRLDRGTGEPIDISLGACKNTVILNHVLPGASESAIRAQNNISRALLYYKNVHGLNGFDGKGTPVYSVVHAGLKMNNAQWDFNKDLMLYGDGDGVTWKDTTVAVDISGHELTHAVIMNSSRLEFTGESGSLQEALCDYFGLMIKGDSSWVIGHDVYLDQSKSQRGIRNLKQPGLIKLDDYAGLNPKLKNRPFPSHYKQAIKVNPGTTCNQENDLCWVHVNSTIISHILYRIHMALGKSQAEKLIFKTMTLSLHQKSDFKDFKNAVVKTCSDLKYPQFKCDQVNDLFEKSGI